MSASALPGPDARCSKVEDLERRITELSAHITAATYEFLVLVREFDEMSGWNGPGLKSCAHWLNWRCGIALGAAREKVRVAHALKALPRTAAAFRKGRLSYSKARAITRVATPSNEDYFLQVAHFGTASHLERLVRAWRFVQRREALARDVRAHQLRELSWHVDDDGMWVLKGRFSSEQGALLQSVLEAHMRDLALEREHAVADEPEEAIKCCPPAAASRRADALLRLAEARSDSPCEIHLHTGLDTLRREGACAESELEDQRNVSAETSRRLACDAAVVNWIERKGEPLSIGRRSRTVPPHIRRALQRRDRGCRFPGCSCERFVDAHHVHHWADGGETALGNLVLLCRHHHRLVHEVGFSVEMQPDGQPRFHDPAGKPLPECGETRFRGNVLQLKALNRDNRLRITHLNARCAWDGKPMDMNMALAALVKREWVSALERAD